MFINVLFDIILVGILLAGAIMGIRHGFVDTLAKPVKFILVLILAFSLARAVGTFLVEPMIGPAISHKLSDVLVEKYAGITAATASEELPTLIKMAASICGVNIQEVATVPEGASVIEAVAAAVTAPVVEIISVIFGFVIAYFISKLLLNFAFILLNNIVNNGIAGRVNKALGCLFSLFLAFVVGWAFTSVCEFVFNIPAIASIKVIDNFEGGIIYNFFRSFSPLDLLLSF